MQRSERRGGRTCYRLSILLALWVCFLPAMEGRAQFFEKEDVFDYAPLDYEKMFREGLSRNGKTLNLSGKKIGDKGVELLLSHEVMKKVTKLDLRYNKISEKGAKLIAESGALKKIKALDLRHNYFLDQGAVYLAQSKGLPNLEKLVLSFNEIRDEGALAFAKTSNFPKLKKLDLRGNFLANATKATLKKDLAHLKSLKLF